MPLNRFFVIPVLAVMAVPALRAQAPVAPAAAAPAAPAAAAAPAALKIEGDIRQGERDRFAAMVKADIGELDKLLAPELSYTHSNAQLQDKGAFLGDIRSGAIKYLSIDATDIFVKVFGNAAYVTGGATVHVTQNGNDLTIKIRYTNMQLNRSGSWQMVAWEATRVP